LVLLVVLAFETWETVTIPPKTASVAAATMIPRLLVNHFGFVAARRY
jgi:hypothetical protein